MNSPIRYIKSVILTMDRSLDDVCHHYLSQHCPLLIRSVFKRQQIISQKNGEFGECGWLPETVFPADLAVEVTS